MTKTSIKTKLTIIILLATISSVLLFSFYLIYLASTSLKDAAVEEAKVLLKSHNQDFIRILLVNTPDLGADTVSRLSQFKHVKDVILYDDNGDIIFAYQTEGIEPPSSIPVREVSIKDNDIYIVEPVSVSDKIYGRVYLRASLDKLTAVLSDFYKASVIALPFLLIFSLLLALIFQRSFSRPIVYLANIMENVTNNNDYSIRVPELKSRELHILYKGFNNMLQIIQNNMDIINKNKTDLTRAQLIAQLGYWEYNADDNKIHLSEGTRDILDCKESELSAGTIYNLIDKKDRLKTLRRISKVLATGESKTMHVKLVTDSFSEKYTFITVERRFDSVLSKHLLFGVIQDITERYLNEKRIRKAILDKQKAEEENHAKSAFLANMNHELRTPLNAILGYSDIIKEEAMKLKQLELVADSEKIQTAGKYLLSLINCVLDLSKIEADKMDLHIEDISVRDTVYEVVTTLEPLLIKGGNKITVKFSDAEDNINLETDLTKLRQILFNLIGNANKFTHNGEITLDIWKCLIKGNEWCFIEIKDSGIGIDPTYVTKLFEPFSQQDGSTTKNFGGTGLGLTISKRYCELLGGKIEVESEVNVGSIFTIRLPIKHQTNTSSLNKIQATG